MTPAERVLAYFDRISEAPDAIARLRRFVFDIAVRGKLVDQDPNDEPASALVAAFRALAKSGRKVANDGAAPQPFEIPPSWTWCRLSDVGTIVAGGTPPSKDEGNFATSGSGIPWLTPADLGRNKALWVSRGARDLTAQGLHNSSATVMPKGTVLFTSRAPIGYTAIAANDISTNQGFKSIVPHHLECNRYIALYFRAFARWIDERASGTTFREVSGKVVAALPFPLPSLAEQQRIVARVDELMALCDRLEASRTDREGARDRFARSSLSRLVEPAVLLADFLRGVRLSLDNLPRTLVSHRHVQELRAAILQLAVTGKLVKQDEHDDSVEELLKSIAVEKARLSQAGRPGRVADDKCEDIEGEFILPTGWRWSSVGEICSKTGSGSTPRGGKESYRQSGIAFLRSQNVHDDGLRLSDVAYIEPATHLAMAGTVVRPRDLLLNITGGSIGRCAKVPDDFPEANVSQHVAIIRVAFDGLQNFLHRLIQSPYFQQLIIAEQTGAGRGGLPKNRMDRIPVAVPPIAEQLRIVTKIDELMAMCDQLETQIEGARTAKTALLEATLRDALSADTRSVALPAGVR